VAEAEEPYQVWRRRRSSRATEPRPSAPPAGPSFLSSPFRLIEVDDVAAA
jgi:hypothetical protein